MLVLPAGDAEPIQDPKELDRPPSEPGYKSPYTHRNYQAPLVPDNKSLTPLNQISLMSNQWKQSSGGHPIGSERKKQKRVNTVQAMYKVLHRTALHLLKGLGDMLGWQRSPAWCHWVNGKGNLVQCNKLNQPEAAAKQILRPHHAYATRLIMPSRHGSCQHMAALCRF